MTPQDRADWCVAQAEEIEKGLPPEGDNGELENMHMFANFWRDLAARILAANGLGPWPDDDHLKPDEYWLQ